VIRTLSNGGRCDRPLLLDFRPTQPTAAPPAGTEQKQRGHRVINQGDKQDLQQVLAA